MNKFALALTLLTAPACWAEGVALAGIMGSKALVVVDGSTPKALAAGESFKGVTLIAAKGDSAVVEVDGQRQTLRLGEAPVAVQGGGSAGASGSRIVLAVGSGGHFFTQGQINGQVAQMVVDTGATAVSLSARDAQRMNINYRTGQPIQMSTANGVVPAWHVKLDSVRVGDVVVHGVDAVVSSGSMPFVLLGNSFLSMFQMTRTADQMVLERRY
ncbi:MAG: TIGR02281 family clan AA aspartic protease [Rhodoferax sp.]